MMIPVEESFAAWRKDPTYVEAYDSLEGEFVLATAAAVWLEISSEPATIVKGLKG
jgi:hypothetical protein